MQVDKFNSSRLCVPGSAVLGGHPLQIPNIVVPPGSADIYCGYFGMTSGLGFQQGSLNIGKNPDAPFSLNSVSGNSNKFDTNITLHTGTLTSSGATLFKGGSFKSLASSNNITGKVSKIVGTKFITASKTATLDAKTGSLTGGTWTYNGVQIETVAHGHSDQRLKRSIIPIDGALEKVKKLNGVSFRWNSDYAEKRNELKTKVITRSIGFIAQEVEKVVPEVINTNKIAGYDFDIKSVDYEKMVALLTEAIKDQQTQIDLLKSEIQDLRTQLNN